MSSDFVVIFLDNISIGFINTLKILFLHCLMQCNLIVKYFYFRLFIKLFSHFNFPKTHVHLKEVK